MPDFIDRLGAELTRAANAEPRPSRAGRVSWRPRWLRSMRPRTLLIMPALVVLGTGAALAAGILLTGAPAGPKVPPVPTAGYGAASPATATLLPLDVADPAGGLPWGLRTVRTTRDDVCLQVGRLADGTIGALGEDGAFGNDHRFHPFSDNYQDPEGCVTLDAHGHGFTSANIWGLPTSAMAGGGCLADFSRRRLVPCPTQDTRNVYFGLLGPHAASITYVSGEGQTVTVPTVGSDGAYLIVTPAPPSMFCSPGPRAPQCEQQGGSSSFGGLLMTGPIRAVTYQDGHTCRPTAPPPRTRARRSDSWPTTRRISHRPSWRRRSTSERCRPAPPHRRNCSSRSPTRRDWPSTSPAASTTYPCSSPPTPAATKLLSARRPAPTSALGNGWPTTSLSLPAATASSADSSDITPPARSTAAPPLPKRQTQAISPLAASASDSPKDASSHVWPKTRSHSGAWSTTERKPDAGGRDRAAQAPALSPAQHSRRGCHSPRDPEAAELDSANACGEAM